MIPQLLLYKILQLFIIMLLGYVLVKTKVVKSKDSLILSKLTLYLFMPAVIINSFSINFSDDGLLGVGYAESATGRAAVSIPEGKTVIKIKMFAWDSLTGLSPLSGSTMYEIK